MSASLIDNNLFASDDSVLVVDVFLEYSLTVDFLMRVLLRDPVAVLVIRAAGLLGI